MTSQTDNPPIIGEIQPMIAMQGVEKWFGNFQALFDINLSVRAGEKIVLCGPSGSGKSTLVRCINHLETYQKGRILIEGIYLDDKPKTIDMARGRDGLSAVQPVSAPHCDAELHARPNTRTRPFQNRCGSDCASASRPCANP
jgi:polar amino acid transport system ATP-binding protein